MGWFCPFVRWFDRPSCVFIDNDLRPSAIVTCLKRPAMAWNVNTPGHFQELSRHHALRHRPIQMVATSRNNGWESLWTGGEGKWPTRVIRGEVFVGKSAIRQLSISATRDISITNKHFQANFIPIHNQLQAFIVNSSHHAVFFSRYRWVHKVCTTVFRVQRPPCLQSK